MAITSLRCTANGYSSRFSHQNLLLFLNFSHYPIAVSCFLYRPSQKVDSHPFYLAVAPTLALTGERLLLACILFIADPNPYIYSDNQKSTLGTLKA